MSCSECIRYVAPVGEQVLDRKSGKAEEGFV
jgi:hypothetical protein